MTNEELMKRLIALETLLITKKIITDDDLKKYNELWEKEKHLD